MQPNGKNTVYISKGYNMDDNGILDLFFARDESALVEVRKRYGQRLFRSAMNILQNNEDAEECVSDTLLKTWEVIPPSRPTMLGAFMAKIARNLSINKYRAKSAVRRGGGEVDVMLSELEDCIPSPKGGVPESEYESAEVTAAINACLESMDKTARVAFVLRYFHWESMRSICQRFNMTESKAKSLLFRARKKLAAHLQKEGINL